MVGAGTLIWISVRPLLRLALCVASGVALTKADLFPPIAARGAGQISLNIGIPCLMFSKMVPAFTSDNIGALGGLAVLDDRHRPDKNICPLVLVGFIYEGLGIIMALIIRQFFWVPHRFRYGLLVAGGWGNYGDIPTSVVMSITGAAPFNGTTDQNLSVAYVAAFILVFMVTFFPCGGHRWIAMDFVGPDVEPEEVREAIRQNRKYLLYGWPTTLVDFLRRGPHFKRDADDTATPSSESGSGDDEKPATTKEVDVGELHQRHRPARHVSFYDDITAVPTEGNQTPAGSPPPTERMYDSRFTSPEPTITAVEAHWSSRSPEASQAHDRPVLPTTEKPSVPVAPNSAAPQSPKRKFGSAVFAHLKAAFKSILTPASITIMVSFLIALVPKLKALFVHVPGTYMPDAPDGQPPLAFIIDFTAFMGALSVPLGLICLGSALARMKVPSNQWSSLPIGAITSLAVGKMLIAPVLGVLLVKGLVHGGLIDKEDKVLQFVCVFFSCLPTATTQVFVTQVYSGTGSADHLPPFLIPQYIMMFVSMTALTAYSLQTLF